MSLTKVQTIGIETGISFTGVTTITSLNATQGANISISSPGVALTITQSGTGGYVQVGTSSTVAVIDNSGRFLVGVASTTSDSRAVFQGSSASATGGTNVYFQRGSTPASGDKLGLFAFADVHGKVGAEISAYADATWSLGDYPGRLVFSTTPDGSSTVTERLRIDDNGNLILDSDLDTYIHHPAADTLAVTTGGSERVRIDSSGRFGIGTNSPSTLIHGAVSSGTANLRLENTATSGEATIQLYGKNSGGTVRTATIKYDNADYFRIGTTAAVAIAFETSDTERLRIDSSGRLLVGTSSSPSSGNGQYSRLVIQGYVGGNASAGIMSLQRGVTASSITTGEGIGEISFNDSSGSTFSKISCEADANGGAGDYPGRLVFSTTADGASSPTERMRLDSSGRLGLGTTSPARPLQVNSTQISARFLSSSSDSQIEIVDSSGTVVFGSSSANAIVQVGGAERARIDSSGRLLVGTSSSRTAISNGFPSLVQVETSAYSAYQAINNTNDPTGAWLALGKSRGTSAGGVTVVQINDELGYIGFVGADGTDVNSIAAAITAQVDGTPGNNDMPGRLMFSTTADGASSPTERMRIANTGNVMINETTDLGYRFQVANSSAAVVRINRNTNDGSLVDFYQDGTVEGSISVSGTTVSYNGAHLSRWSQLPSGAERIEILRGSVLSNIDEMCEWGDEENEQLNRMKVSDVEGDKNVSGVFQAWDDDDDTYVNDFYCAMTGDFIIRIGAGVTVERGDLLMSAGDGTAKPQDDDIIRSKTIAKVTSTNVSCTYDDGSYCVPCVLMAC